MMTVGKNTPAIRFKGFGEEWKERELNQIANRYDNLRFPIKASNRVFGNTPYYGANGIQDYVEGYTHDGEFLLVAEDGANDLKKYPINYVNGKIWVNNHAHVLQGKKKEINNIFLGFILSKTNFEEFLVGGGRAKLNSDTMMKIIVHVCLDFSEQTQIGNYFKKLDYLIQLQEQKQEKVTNLKKAMLEKMFPKENAIVPEVRFKGFTKKWEKKKLEEVVNISSALRVHKNEWTTSGIPFFRSSDVVSSYKGKANTKAYISNELYLKLSAISGPVKKGDILITGGGSIGIPYLIKSDNSLYFKDADLLWIKNINNINGYFLYTFFLTQVFRSYIESITHIGTISHYTIEQAKCTPAALPDPLEQQKIGEYFQSLDKLINQSKQKIEQLKHLKQALLQKMFI